jgi:hypothetical protein
MAVATNTFPVSSLIAKAAVRSLRNNFIAVSRATTNVASTFGLKGYKTGDTIQIKLPARYVSGTGPAIVKNNTSESLVSLSVIQRNIGLGAITKDLTLSIDSLMQYIDPVMAQLASDIDSDALSLYYKAENLTTPGAYVAGAPAQWTGADLATLRPFLDARARLMDQGMPSDGMAYLAVTPSQSAGVVDGLKSLFQDSTQIADQYKRGLMGIAAGFEWVESQVLPRHIAGTRTNGTVTGAGQTGSTLVIGGVGAAGTINRGDQFTISGVFAINRLTRVASNKLQVFSVQAASTADGAGAASILIAPAINVTSPGQTVSAGPGAAAVVTWMGAANAATDVALAWHKTALYAAFLELESDLAGAECAMETDPASGLSVRILKQYNSETDEVVFRADVLYGFQVVRGNLMCRIQG